MRIIFTAIFFTGTILGAIGGTIAFIIRTAWVGPEFKNEKGTFNWIMEFNMYHLFTMFMAGKLVQPVTDFLQDRQYIKAN